jgi:hypothetical protein
VEGLQQEKRELSRSHALLTEAEGQSEVALASYREQVSSPCWNFHEAP